MHNIIYVINSIPDDLKRITIYLQRVFPSIHSFSSAEEFLQMYEHETSGCLILANELTGIKGTELLSLLVTQKSCLLTIMTMPIKIYELAVAAFRGGAFDVLEGTITDNFLIARVTAGLNKSSKMQMQKNAQKEIAFLYQTTSQRERQIIALIINGKSNKNIGQELGISEKTVETHKYRSLKKMEANNTLELARMITLLNPYKL